MCTKFTGTVTATSLDLDVHLKILTNGLPGALTDYTVAITTNTTGNTIASPQLLSAYSGAGVNLGRMAAGAQVVYEITRVDAGTLSGSLAMRAVETPNNVTADATAACSGSAWRVQRRQLGRH